MLLNNSKQTVQSTRQAKYFTLNTNDKTDTTKWNISTNYNFSQKAKMALVCVNNATDSNLNFTFCPTIKNNYISSLNTPPLIYAGIGYNNQNIINEKQYFEVNGAFLNEIELKTYSSPPQNDLIYNFPQIARFTTPYIWYKFNQDMKESLGGSAYDFAVFDDFASVNKNELSLVNGAVKCASAFPLYTLWLANGITFSFWVYLDQTGGANDEVFALWSNTNSTAVESYYYVRCTRLTGGLLRFTIRSGLSPGGTGINTGVLNTNTWYHISWSIATNALWTIYINGVLFDNTTSRTIANVVWDNFYIGRTVGPNLPTQFFTGKIKDFRIYRNILTQNEVSILATNYFTDNDLRRINYPIIKNETLKLTTDNDPNIHTIPNLWLRFETGALTTNSGTDSITLTNGGTTLNSGVSVRGNNSINFNGTSQYLTGNIQGLANNSFSICYWVYPRAFLGDMFDIGTVYTENNNIMTYFSASYGYKYSFSFQTNNTYLVNAYPNDINNWVHLVFIFDLPNRQRYIYRNGVKESVIHSLPTINPYTGNTSFSIGKWSGAVSDFFNGNMDDLRVYTGKVLTPEEITRIYNGTKTDYTTQITEPIIGMDLNPVIWYKFDNSTNVGLDSMGVVNLVQDGLNFPMTYDSVGAIKGNGSLKGTAETTLILTYDYSHFVDAITIAFWMKINDGTISYSTVFKNADGLLYFAKSATTSNIDVALFGSGYQDATHFSGAFVGDKVWKHYTLIAEKTLSGAVKITSYLNGVFSATATSGTWSKTGLTGLNLSDVYYSLIGNLDDMRFYNRVLSQAQINEIYAGNPYYNLPTASTRYNTDPTNTQYQFECVDTKQELI